MKDPNQKSLQELHNDHTSQAQDHMEGQEHHLEVQDQTSTCTVFFHLPLHMRNIDPHCRATEEDTSDANEMLP